MNKQRERLHKTRRQKTWSPWWIGAGIALVLIAALWFIFSGRQSQSGETIAISRLSTSDFHSVAFSPTEVDTVFFGHHHGLMVSHDGGRNWQTTTFPNADAMAVALSLSDPHIMYAAGHDVFYKTMNGGKTWDSLRPDLPGLDIHGFAIDPKNGNRVYAHVVGYGIFSSQDGGMTWTQLSSAPSSTMSLAMGENSDSLYAASMQTGLFHSQDGGQTWTSMPGIPGEGVMAVAYAAGDHRIWIATMGTAAGLYASKDGGTSWTPTDLRGSILAIAISPLDTRHILAVDDQGQVFASRDGGTTWNDR